MTHSTRGTVYVSRAGNRRMTVRLFGGVGTFALLFVGAVGIAALLISAVTS